MSRAIPIATGTGDVQGFTGPCTLVGFSARETGVGTADVTLRDGTSVAGPIAGVIRMLINGSQADVLPAVDFTTGIFIDRTGAGSSELVLYIL